MQKLVILVFLLLSFASVGKAQDVTPADLAAPDGHFVQINGAEVYYVERGPADGPAVILLHGFGGSTFTWRYTMDALAEARFRVIAFDMPPFGLSDKDPDLDFSLAAQTNLLAGLMDKLNVQQSHLIGHSAGGSVIADFALRYPERVDKLVFVAAAIGMTEEDSAGSDGGPEAVFSFVSRLDPESPLAQAALRAFLTQERFTELLASAYYNQEVVTPEVEAGYQVALQIEGWEAGLLAFIRDSSDEARNTLDMEALASIEAPVLLIWGEEDTWVPIAVGERLRALLSHARWISYPAVGHLPMEEAPEEFNRDLLEFLGVP